MLLALLACTPPADPPKGDPVAFCEGPTHFLWDTEGALNVFPDDHRTVPAETPTGLRIDLDPADHAFLAAYPEGFVDIFAALSTLDGWGLSSGIWFQADAPLAALPDVHVFANGEEVAVDRSTTDDGATLLILPRGPLPESTEITVVVTTDPADAACLSPAPLLRDLLDPATADPPAQAGRYQAALAALEIDPANVAAMTVYTTQSASHVSRLVAADVAGRSYAFAPGTCVDGASWRQCDGVIPMNDYRASDHIVSPDADGSPVSTYDLPTRIWTPLTGSPPYPTVLCGHGLGGDRGQCAVLADLAAPAGIAVVAVDAVESGDHPGRTESELSLLDDLMILAISVNPPGLNALRLRDNFRQSAWDKLQVIRAIEGGVDADGDGVVDLDPDHLGYIGVSLGAIMGPEPLALTDSIDGAVLLVGGARISSIIQDSPTFSVLVDLMRPADTSDGEVDRFFPVLQTVIDAGDPATYAPHLVRDRYGGASTPSLLNAMVYQDQIVPNSTNEALARALALPGVGSELWAVPDLSFAPGPVSGNLPSGATGGTLQYAEVQESVGGAWVTAEHDNLHESVTGQDEILAFLLPLLTGQTPVILEPERP